MHPVFAAKSCDPEGNYVRKWLPQLAGLPVEYIHCPWEAPFGMRASARLLLCEDRRGKRGNFPQRVVTDLEAARKRSHAAVMAVRRGVGKRFALPSGHEWYELDSGRRVVLITRQDYREGGVTREGERITGDEILTRQTPEQARAHTTLALRRPRRRVSTPLPSARPLLSLLLSLTRAPPPQPSRSGTSRAASAPTS